MGNKKVYFSSSNANQLVKTKSWRYLNVERDLRALDEWYDLRRCINDSVNRLCLLELELSGVINGKSIIDEIEKQHVNLKKAIDIIDEVISVEKELIILQCPKMAKYLRT